MHYNDVIMGTIASQITSLTIGYSIVYADADQRKHQSSASLAFVRWIHRGPMNSPHKWPVTRKMFPFDDVIMDTKVLFVCLFNGLQFYWQMEQGRSVAVVIFGYYIQECFLLQYLYRCMNSFHNSHIALKPLNLLGSQRSGDRVGATKSISSVPLISRFFTIVKTLVTYWISCSYLTGVKYECEANNLTGTFARSKILLSEKLTNGDLVTPTTGLSASGRFLSKLR